MTILEHIPVFQLSLNTPMFYRVRAEFTEGVNRYSAYSYNPNAVNIERLRFNKECEQVLYTATSPCVAVKETLRKETPFYLSKWKGIYENGVMSFVAIDDNCSDDENSNSRKVRRIIKDKATKEELLEIDQMRKILEKDYTDYPEETRYIESSELASFILKSAECILSYSAHDDKELNVTFNKQTVDDKLALDTVYHCRPNHNHQSLFFDVSEVGLPNGDSVIWYDWRVDESSLIIDSQAGYILDEVGILRILHRNPGNACVGINVNQPINGYHKGVIITDVGHYRISYKIILTTKNRLQK